MGASSGLPSYHDVDNVSWLMVPNLGSHDDPRVTSLLLLVTVLIVATAWGPCADP